MSVWEENLWRKSIQLQAGGQSSGPIWWPCDLGSLNFSPPQFLYLQSEDPEAADIQVLGVNVISDNNLSFGESTTSPWPTPF